MKRVFLITVLIALSIGAMAQSSNTFKYVVKAKGGVSIGDHTVAGTNVVAIDSVAEIGGKLYFFVGGDTTGVATLATDITDLFDVAMKLYPDTLLVTTTEFRPQLTHVNRYIRCNKATQIKVFLPPDTTVNFPIGSTLNFKMDNAGIVKFYRSNSIIESKKDSVTINFKGGWATAIKRAANKWDLLGDLTD